MTGKTHKAIGTSVGVAMVMYGVRTGNALLALGMLTAPIGAMLPDIDHDSSKLGKSRKSVVKAIRITAITLAILSVLTAIVLVAMDLALSSIKVVLVVLPLSAVMIVATSEWFKKKFPFLTGHRAIMHTLVVPCVMVICASGIDIQFIQALLLGLSLGYASHIFADCLTIMGCPIAFPVSKECYHFLPVRTGTIWEYVTAAVLVVVITAVSAVYKPEAGGMYIIACPLALVFSRALGDKISEMMCRRKKGLNILTIIIVAIDIIVILLSRNVGFKLCVGLACIGWVIGVVSSRKRSVRSHGRLYTRSAK